MALTDVKVRSAKPTDKAFKLTDGEGMHLMVHPNGSKYLAASVPFRWQTENVGARCLS